MKRVLVAIPAYNEAATIAAVITDHGNALRAVGIESDVLVVDDGSRDETAVIARAAGASVIEHGVNKGLGVAFRNAVKHAIAGKYAAMLTVDADGQFSSENSANLLSPVLDGKAGICTASRFLPSSRVTGIPGVKRIGNALVTWLINSITRERFTDVSCGFRAYSREALLHLHLFGAYTYTHEVILNAATKGLRIVEMPVAVTYFPGRRSRIASSLFRYGWRTSGIILRSTIAYQPFRLFGSLAFGLWIISVPVLLILGTRYLLTDLFSPYKGIGITALLMLGLGLTSFSAGLLLEVSRRAQLTLEEILYYQKRSSNE
jgi:glycosyltransferase involved in cell wall biosynthesis